MVSLSVQELESILNIYLGFQLRESTSFALLRPTQTPRTEDTRSEQHRHHVCRDCVNRIHIVDKRKSAPTGMIAMQNIAEASVDIQ